MIPTWTVYRDLKGRLDAIDPMKDIPDEFIDLITKDRIVGYVTAHNKEDAINYMEAILK